MEPNDLVSMAYFPLLMDSPSKCRMIDLQNLELVDQQIIVLPVPIPRWKNVKTIAIAEPSHEEFSCPA